MNTLSVEKTLSKYKIYDLPFLHIKVDNIYVDSFLDARVPDRHFDGLVPTTSGWLHDEEDERFIWRQFFLTEKGVLIVPLLVCPDDQDFFCTTIVVEIERADQVVRWNRFGLNNKFEVRKYEMIGIDVEWLNGIEPLVFSKENYHEVFDLLKSSRAAQ